MEKESVCVCVTMRIRRNYIGRKKGHRKLERFRTCETSDEAIKASPFYRISFFLVSMFFLGLVSVTLSIFVCLRLKFKLLREAKRNCVVFSIFDACFDDMTRFG